MMAWSPLARAEKVARVKRRSSQPNSSSSSMEVINWSKVVRGSKATRGPQVPGGHGVEPRSERARPCLPASSSTPIIVQTRSSFPTKPYIDPAHSPATMSAYHTVRFKTNSSSSDIVGNIEETPAVQAASFIRLLTSVWARHGCVAVVVVALTHLQRHHRLHPHHLPPLATDSQLKKPPHTTCCCALQSSSRRRGWCALVVPYMPCWRARPPSQVEGRCEELLRRYQ